jgi:hypothetical protein
MGVYRMNRLNKERSPRKGLLNCSGGLRPPVGAHRAPLQLDLSGLRIL